MAFPTEDINRLLRQRRSIFPKSYSQETVPDAVIEQMLENANWAPTHKLTQPWRFAVYTGQGLRKLGEWQANLYKQVAQADGTYLEKKYLNLLEKPGQASHVIVIMMQRDPEERIREEEELASVAMAVQNMHLTAAAYGLGAYWGTGGVTYFPEAKAEFGLGPNDRLLGFFYVGQPHPDEEIPDSKRSPMAEKVRWVRE